MLSLIHICYNTQNTCTDDRCCRKANPKGRIEVIACFRRVTQFIVHHDNGGFSNLDRSLLVRREDISGKSIVADLANHLITDTQVFDVDFTVPVSLEGLVIGISSCNTEREALNLAIRRCLDDF